MDGLRAAAHLLDAATGSAGAGGGRTQYRRIARADHPPRHGSAVALRLNRLWLLMFLIFEREYSTGVYLLSPGTETIGSMLVSLWAAGAIDIVAALSFINILLVVVGLGIALRFGVKLHD